MKYMINRTVGYYSSIFPILLVIIGNLLGGYFTLLNIFFSFGFLVVADWFFSENRTKPRITSSFIPNSVLIIHVIFHSLAVGSLLYGVFIGIIQGSFILTNSEQRKLQELYLTYSTYKFSLLS